MEEKEMLEIDIDNLKDAYNRIQEALNDLKDVENYSDAQYEELGYLAEEINDLRIEKENRLERLEERICG